MEPRTEQERDQEPVRVARRVYVGNLSFKTSWQDLKDYFSRVGTVRYADILREGGGSTRSKGCGIVEFETPEEALAAILQLSHSELDGRQIFVREDREDFELKGDEAPSPLDLRPQPPQQRSTYKRPRVLMGGQRSNALSIGRRVYVGNLGYETTWQQLKDHFRQAGHVVRADILEGSEGLSKGCGLVEFESPADALRSISLLSNSILNGRQIMVREDREDPVVGGSSRRGGGGSVGGTSSAAGPMRGGVGEGIVEATRVVVHGLPYRMAWQDLKDLCRQAGQVVRADVLTNPDGSSKGYGLVEFATPQAAEAAVRMLNGRAVEGCVLSVRYDRFAPPE